ncbi:putative C2H2 type zinc-finger (2 copies) [Lyophyllum shimeji]|uniref:C2H2 type zinc-finger (2 copies) n=1 Tax=Lyophyllum shimeji TaxID=47721 RepID=A0A9P3PKN7_LYOSH|nr:putative C2H2 type zinc-finger (2 copies) [Lyophyllum shimeji]
MEQAQSEPVLFTCLSCSIAFFSAEEQRVHYRSDYHRYNMKRRVASLPPVSAAVFDSKVLERRAETAVMPSTKESTCTICNKIYTTEGAYKSHTNSRKHKDNETKAAATAKGDPQPTPEPVVVPSDPESSVSPPVATETAPDDFLPALETKTESLSIEASTAYEDLERTIDEKIAAARARLSPSHCLFCTLEASSIEDNLTHMSHSHSFFIPDAEYLVDIQGLVTYLGEKIAVGNVCIFCGDKGREFRSLEAVRKHMIDKSHCKIAYDSPDDRLEISDFYDFTSSYPDAEPRKNRHKESTSEETDVWEDVEGDDDGDVDEIVDEDAFDEDSGSETETDESLPGNALTYGDSHLELVLPSGARIGHRTMRRYYAQSFAGSHKGTKPEDPNSGAALVRRLLADKNSALVPRKGGFGAFGSGTDVVKARNRGEAREAGRHVREFRDQRRREDFKTKVGFIANHQKHYRDPLLQ